MYYMLDLVWPDDFGLDETDYYELESLDDEAAELPWLMGERFPVPPTEPIPLQVMESDDCIFPPLYLDPLPLMRSDVAAIFRGCGVDNLDFYATTLAAPKGWAVPEYHAFNIVGKIAAADMAKSEISPSLGDMLISAQVHKLAIDPAKARGALMFRLAESVDGIVVHESIKAAVEAAKIEGLSFLEPEEWSSF